MLRGAQCFAAFVYLCTILFAKAQEERVPSHFKVGDEILALPEVSLPSLSNMLQYLVSFYCPF